MPKKIRYQQIGGDLQNGGGYIVTYNIITGEFAQRTGDQIISDLSLATTVQLGNYLPLSGGTLTGGGAISSNGDIIVQQTEVGGNATGLFWQDIPNSQFISGIGAYTEHGNHYWHYLGWGAYPWSTATSLAVGDNVFTYKDHKVYHAGNVENFIFGTNWTGTTEASSYDLGLPPNSFKPSKSGFYRPNNENDYGSLLIWVSHTYTTNEYGVGIAFGYDGLEAYITGTDSAGNKTPNRRIWQSENFNPDTKVNNIESVIGIGFTASDPNLAPYFYHPVAGHRFLGTQTWVNTNFIPKTHPAYGITQNYLDGWFSYWGYGNSSVLSPSSIQPTKFQFGFTSWNQNNNSPFADYLHFGGYTDSSGQNQNLIVFNKQTFGLRQYQGTWQSPTAYQSFVDYWNTGNLPDPLRNNGNNTLKTITTANYNDVVDGGGMIWLGDVYGIPTSDTGMESIYGTIFNLNGLVSHDKTQLIFNGQNGHIQYRKSFYANTAWTAPRTIWDNDNLPNPMASRGGWFNAFTAKTDNINSITQYSGDPATTGFKSYYGTSLHLRGSDNWWYHRLDFSTDGDRIDLWQGINVTDMSYKGKIPIIPDGITNWTNENLPDYRIYGLGNFVPQYEMNVNTPKPTGFYSYYGGITTGDSPFGYATILHHSYMGSSEFSQIAIQKGAIGMAFRTDSTDWKKVYHEDNFNPGDYVHRTIDQDVGGLKTFTGVYSAWQLNGDNYYARGFIQSLPSRVAIGTTNDNDVVFYRNVIEKVRIADSFTEFYHWVVVPDGLYDQHAVNMGQLNTKVSKSGDTMTGTLSLTNGANIRINGTDSNWVQSYRNTTGDTGIVAAFEYAHYATRWKGGMKRGGGTNSLGFSYEFSEDDGATYTEKVLIQPDSNIVTQSFGSANLWYYAYQQVNNKVSKSGDTMTGNLYALTISAQNTTDRLIYDRIENYGSPLKINANASLGIYLQADYNNILYVGTSYLETYRDLYVSNGSTLYTSSHGNSSQWYTSYQNGLVNRGAVFQSNVDANNLGNQQSAIVSIELGNGTGNTNFPVNNTYGTFMKMTAVSFTSEFFHENGGELWHRNWYLGSSPQSTPFRKIWDSVNFNPAQYVTTSSLNSTLAGYATLAGVQTFQNTITFSQSPVIPTGTLGSHAVNLAQVTGNFVERPGGYSVLISNANLNSYFSTGFFRGVNLVNAPENNTGWWYITVEGHDGSWCKQTATTYGSGNIPNRTFQRVCSGGNWGSWYQVWTTQDITLTNILQWNDIFNYGVRVNNIFTGNSGHSLALIDEYNGGDGGLYDIDYGKIVAGKDSPEFLKYGSNYNEWNGININIGNDLIGIGKATTNDEDKVQVAGNISVEAVDFNTVPIDLILNPLYNTDGNVRFSRNFHITIVTSQPVLLPQKPILGQTFIIHNNSDSPIPVSHDNVGVLFTLEAYQKITGDAYSRGYLFDRDPKEFKKYDIE